MKLPLSSTVNDFGVSVNVVGKIDNAGDLRPDTVAHFHTSRALDFVDPVESMKSDVHV